MHLAEVGLTWSEIADELKCDQKTVWNLRAEYEIDAILAQRNADAMQATLQARIALARKSSKLLREWLDSDDFEKQRFAIDRVYPKAGNGAGEVPLLPPPLPRKGEHAKSAADIIAAAREAHRGRLGKGR